jgi:elongation factor Ts
MEIRATDVKLLREKTAAGMLDCRNALVKAGGDFVKAERLLKEQGLAAAVKKSGRLTNQGKIFAKVLPDRGILLELTCETDFVARNSLFLELGNRLVQMVADQGLTEKTPPMDLLVKEAIGTIKENMELRRLAVVRVPSDEVLVDYVHEDRIGVLARFRVGSAAAKDTPKVKATLFDCALHIAAYAPLFFSKEKVTPGFVKEQEEIFTKQVENLGKPANVLAGIVKGKVNKLFSDICFLEQPFVKDDKRTVAKVLADLGKEAGTTIEAVDYVYMKLGDVQG